MSPLRHAWVFKADRTPPGFWEKILLFEIIDYSEFLFPTLTANRRFPSIIWRAKAETSHFVM